MRKIIDLAFVTTVTLAASAHAFADPASTDSKLSEAWCRASMDRAASSLSAFEKFVAASEKNIDFEAWEKKYFDRFDTDKAITLTGVVKEFQWSNPRARIMLTVRNEQGQADQQWVIEMNGPTGLARLGVATENAHTRHADHCDHSSAARRLEWRPPFDR